MFYKVGDARTAIGEDVPHDWSLQPSKHADALGPECGSLVRVIRRSHLEETIGALEAADRDAVRARNRYKWLANWSARFSFVAALIAVLVLLVTVGLLDWASHLKWLSYAQAAALGLSIVLSFLLAYFRPFAAWMEHRAEAEYQRIHYFDRVVGAEEPAADGELPLLPLQLEYFRRYQLDVQRKYYKERGAEHQRAERWATGLRVIALIIIGLSVVPALAAGFGWSVTDLTGGFIGGADQRDAQKLDILVIALSTAGAALQGLLAASALINLDERNAARYAATSQNLETLGSRPLDEARTAAAAGDVKSVRDFVQLVQDQTSSEHREWVDLRRVAPNQSLKQLKEVWHIRK
ncbi:MAG: hypothetical protein AB7U49_16135 [Hyphomicrobiaceae bacterium]